MSPSPCAGRPLPFGSLGQYRDNRLRLGVREISPSLLIFSLSFRFAGGEGAHRRSGRCVFGTRPKGRTPRAGRSVAASVSTSRGRGSSSGGQAAGVSGSGEVQARPRAGSGGAGQTKALSTRIWQARDGGVESSSPTRKATPTRGKTLGQHVSAASRPDPESDDAPAC